MRLQAEADVFAANGSFHPCRTAAALVIAICALAEGGIVTTIDSEHVRIIVQLSYNLQELFCMLLKINNLSMVEAAGVEPASENVTGQETTCLFAFMPSALPRTFTAHAQNGQETLAASLRS